MYGQYARCNSPSIIRSVHFVKIKLKSMINLPFAFNGDHEPPEMDEQTGFFFSNDYA